MAKGGLARERFEQKKQRNKIISQLERLKGAGYTTEDIRAAGPNAWQTLQGWAPTTPATQTPGAELITPTATAGLITPTASQPGVPGFSIPAGATALTAEAQQRAGYTGSPTGPYGAPPDWYKQQQQGRVQPVRGGRPGQGAPNWWQTAQSVLAPTLSTIMPMLSPMFAPLGAMGAAQGLTNAVKNIPNMPAWLGGSGSTMGVRPNPTNTGATTGARVPAPAQPAPTFQYGGYSYNNKRYRRRGGGGRGRQYQQPQQQYGEYAQPEERPAWYQGLANWTIG